MKVFIITGLFAICVGAISCDRKSGAKTNKEAIAETPGNPIDSPYKDSSTNLLYNMLFCDNLELYKSHTQLPYSYPFDILFSETSTPTELKKIISDTGTDTRIKLLANNKLLAGGYKPAMKELFGVIVEVGLNEGLDVLASFNDGTARYINQTGKLLVWERATDMKANELTRNLFKNSIPVVNLVGKSDHTRNQHPAKDRAKITFLVSDGLHFREAAVDDLFNDPFTGPALLSATQLMQYLTEKSLEKEKGH